MPRLAYDEILDVLLRVLLKLGFAPERGVLCARLFAEASRDGVPSHGLNRFPQFVRMIHAGIVRVDAEPIEVASFGALERWNGKSGPGNLNALRCMHRAIELSRTHGLGCVALANTNHWMRGGSYGWQAAEAGVIGICWTNTLANVPPWGASDPRVGNNPLIIAVPRPSGHVVLDMAMSQFAYGVLAAYRIRGEQLPFDGGFDSAGRLTRDPATIEASKRPLPIGYWKGSGLALMLEIVAVLLAGGQPTYQIPTESDKETKLSQVFLALDPSRLDVTGDSVRLVNAIIEHFQSTPGGERVRYPGERVLQTRNENLANGIPVEPSIWLEIEELAS